MTSRPLFKEMIAFLLCYHKKSRSMQWSKQKSKMPTTYFTYNKALREICEKTRHSVFLTIDLDAIPNKALELTM